MRARPSTGCLWTPTRYLTNSRTPAAGDPLRSMPLEATVLIPTHDHGPLLLHSARSALAQTVEEIEVFISGDGVPEVTREIVSELKRDERVRFFDHPKGPRHGEIY